MNVWADKWDDMRLSLNDIYMTLLMTGWMFFFMGVYYKEVPILCIGLLLTVASLCCIRTQFMVTTKQYILGMIPHHSMAVLMSKRLVEQRPPLLREFALNIIQAQEKEIAYMKRVYLNFA